MAPPPEGQRAFVPVSWFQNGEDSLFRFVLELFQHMLLAVRSYEWRAFYCCLLLLSPRFDAVAYIVTDCDARSSRSILGARLVPRFLLGLLTDTQRYSGGHRQKKEKRASRYGTVRSLSVHYQVL